MKRTIFTRLQSPVGNLLLVGDKIDDGDADQAQAQQRGFALRGIYFADTPQVEDAILHKLDDAREDQGAFADVTDQLSHYFSGRRTTFDLPIAPQGTSFQRDVWRALGTIPYGKTRTYADIASAIGKPRAVRAVGAANGKNPLSIVVPCHRVIGKDGTLTGYAGGIANKKALLDLEATHACIGASDGNAA